MVKLSIRPAGDASLGTDIDSHGTVHPKFQSCERQDPTTAAHVHQGSTPSSFEVLEHEAEAQLRGGMAGREGSAGFQKNPDRGPRNQKAPPGRTYSERAIDAVASKHDVTSSRTEGIAREKKGPESCQYLRDSWPPCQPFDGACAELSRGAQGLKQKHRGAF